MFTPRTGKQEGPGANARALKEKGKKTEKNAFAAGMALTL